MNNVTRSIEHIRTIPEALVDCGVGQGPEEFFAQLAKHQSYLPEPALPFDWFVSETQRCFADVHDWVSPHRLPADYAFFLEYCGGLVIRSEHYRFVVYGFGPMVMEWYSYVGPDDGSYRDGLLRIGSLGWTSGEQLQHVDFNLDLGGVVQQYCIIEKPWWTLKHKGLLLKHTSKIPEVHYSDHAKIADSFSEWLERAAFTDGAFGRF